MNLNVEYPATPEGKRKVHKNVWGNINGYVGNKRFWEFGHNSFDMMVAELWAKGNTLEDAYDLDDKIGAGEME